MKNNATIDENVKTFNGMRAYQNKMIHDRTDQTKNRKKKLKVLEILAFMLYSLVMIFVGYILAVLFF